MHAVGHHFAWLPRRARRRLAVAQAIYKGYEDRAVRHGRARESLLIYNGIVPIAASTRAQAEARLVQMNGFIVIDHVLAKLSEFLGTDLSQADLDAPLPESAGTNQAQNQSSQSRVTVLIGIARRDRLNLRQVLMRLASGRGHLLTVGTGADIASTMQEWFQTRAADGFNVMAPVMPHDLASFTELVIPDLIARKLFAVDAQPTLRQRLGLGY